MVDRPPVRFTPDVARARLRAEAERLADLRERAAPPPDCGPEIPVAPARGPMRAFMPYVQVGNARRPDGYHAPGEDRPRKAAAQADVWDRMERDARRRHEAAGGEAAAFVAPFTPSQVRAARTYRALVERHEAGGIRCASLEARVQAGGGAGGGFADAYLAEGRAIERIRAAVGSGRSLTPQRLAPHALGGRSGIADRVLVDLVALGDRTLSEVLRLHRWAPKGAAREGLRRALAAALDRMARVC